MILSRIKVMQYMFFILLVQFVFYNTANAQLRNMPASLSTEANIKVSTEELKFEYVSQDGTYWQDCAHWQQDDSLPDWDVICGKGSDHVTRFHVVFWLRKYFRGKQMALENVYYVTDRNGKDLRFVSHSNWIELANQTEVGFMKFYQGVENDYASLSLSYSPRRTGSASSAAKFLPHKKLRSSRLRLQNANLAL